MCSLVKKSLKLRTIISMNILKIRKTTHKTNATHKIPITLLLFIAVLSSSIVCLEKAEPINFNYDHRQYDKKWLIIDSLTNKGLTRSALEKIDLLYEKAKKEKQTPQIIKTLIHKLKYESCIEEDAYMKAIYKVSEEVKVSVYPAKAILHSMLASIYWKYYTDHRWEFSDRSATVNFQPDDVRTWDLKKISEETIKNYVLSLKESDKLKKTQINIFDEILVVKDTLSRKLRPTLYDFLANRVLDFFMNEEVELIKPAYTFEIDNPKYFESYTKFSKLKIDSKDKKSLKLQSLKIIQNLINFHKNDSNPRALADIDLKRLSFVRNQSVIDNKDSLYLIALHKLEKKISAHPSVSEVWYAIANVCFSRGQKYKPIVSDTNKWDIKKAYDICQKVIAKYDSSEYGVASCKNLMSIIENKDLKLIIESVSLPGKPFRALVEYENVKDVYVKVVKSDMHWYMNMNRKYRSVKKVQKLLKLKSVLDFKVSLPNDGDFQQHSTEITIPKLTSGYYILLVSANKDFPIKNNAVLYAPFQISNISYIQRNYVNKGYTELYLLNRSSGFPLNKAIAQVYKKHYDRKHKKYIFKKIKKYTSDASGYIRIPPGKNSENIHLEITQGNDKLYSESFYSNRFYKQKMRKRTRVVFFTDRSIYRPGQTIYFKGIVLEKTNDKTVIIPDYKTDVILRDVNYQKVSELSLKSNEYGTFNGSFVIPTGGLSGNMSLESKHGSHYFVAEEYKRPKFEVVVNPSQKEYRLNDKVIITASAKAYSGFNIDNAAYRYRVVREALFPDWWFWSRWYYPIHDDPKMEITNGIGKTDEKGEFSISFMAIPDLGIAKKSKPKFRYTVFVDVTDINGETHSAQKTTTIGYAALNLSIAFPEQLDKASKEKIVISTRNLDGQYQYAEGVITVYKLKEPSHLFRKRLWNQPDKHIISQDEYYTKFPHDLYKDENNYKKWEKGERVYEKKFNTEKDSLFLPGKLKRWKIGQYVMEATSKDAYGVSVKDVKYFTLFSGTGKKVPQHTQNWFSVLNKKAEPGEKIKILFGTKDKNVRALFEVERNGIIIKKNWLTLNNEQKVLQYTVVEKDRGNIAVTITFIKNNRIYANNKIITIPYTNKELDITFETFRNKLLPGQKEEWKIKIKGKKGEKVAAELVASLYDASLDAFKHHDWALHIYKTYGYQLAWNSNRMFSTQRGQMIERGWNQISSMPNRVFDLLNNYNFYGLEYYGNYRMGLKRGGSGKGFGAGVCFASSKMSKDNDSQEMLMASSAPPATIKKMHKKDKYSSAGSGKNKHLKREPSHNANLSFVKTRTNFNETAFFYPQLKTNKDGDVILSFTMPQALTKWKFLGLAHTKDLKIGLITKEIQTQKELMVTSNAPRFFRELDTITFTAKVSNVSGKNMSGNAQLLLFDALTLKPVDALFGNNKKKNSFNIKKGHSARLAWDIIIPEQVQAVTFKIVAKAGKFSDGEEMAIPVLSNRMLVTEALPLPIRGKETKTYELKKLINSKKSSTLKNHKLTLEYTSNPAWYAIMALPYLMESSYDCSEQVFCRFYANSIASHIANSTPRIKKVFDNWKSLTPDALLSNLEKNQELKELLLQETPWVLQAKDEAQRKQRVGLLFDLNNMSNELKSTMLKLQTMQDSNGGWAWFKGMHVSRYITQHIITGMGHLDNIGIKDIRSNKQVYRMIKNAVSYLDNEMKKDYDWLIKNSPGSMKKNHLSSITIQYLYARTYFLNDIPLPAKCKDAFGYYKEQAKKYWLDNSRYMQGMIACALNRLDNRATALDIMKSLKENAIFHKEMGMYWKSVSGGYYWHQAPIETMALLAEAFHEVTQDVKSVEAIKLWLLKNKQTNDWKTTKATTDACYALLLRGTDWLANEPNIKITVGSKIIDPKKLPDVKAEAGTGYFKTSWDAKEIKPEMGRVKVEKKDDGVSWGALYWQYFEQLDKITTHKTPLKLKKQLFVEKNTDTGPVITPFKGLNTLKIGDKVKVRIELYVDRDMEYVHMKDMRASGFEAINVLSGYKYQDGLGYYEATKDASTNFFMNHLPKGTYVFEYPLRVSHAGQFSNGITTIQCMYAPEFSSHSEGVRVRIVE